MPPTLDWLINHLTIPPIFYIAYRFIATIRILEQKWMVLESKVIDAQVTSKEIATNHLPHMQETLTRIDTNIAGLRDDIRGLRNKI